MQITYKLYYMIVKSAAKVQQKMHIRKKISKKTRIILLKKQLRQLSLESTPSSDKGNI